MATLTYDYRQATAVIGPLSQEAEPQADDLCARHAQRFTVPQGWEVVRIPFDMTAPPPPADDDLEALADAIRRASQSTSPREKVESAPPRQWGAAASEKAETTDSPIRHLRALPDLEED